MITFNLFVVIAASFFVRKGCSHFITEIVPYPENPEKKERI
jgi:hypothetical protein